LSPTFKALRHRNFRLYAYGAVVSNVGTWMQRVAQDWMVLQLTGNSGAAVGITTGLQFLPMLLLSPYAGLIADRFPKRRLLQVTQVMLGVPAIALGALAVTGHVQIWHVYVLAFVAGIGAAFDAPARQAFVSDLVIEDDLTNAVGLNAASFHLARMIGPAVAGWTIVALGSGVAATGWVVIINGLSFGAVILSLQLLRFPGGLEYDIIPRTPGMIREGIRYVRGRPDIMAVLVVVFFTGTFGLNFQMTSALMATTVYGKGAGEYGMLGSYMAVGSLAGALIVARIGRPRLGLVIFAATAFGVSEMAAGLMPSYITFALLTPLLGITALTTITSANASIQTSVSGPLRGRVLALYLMVFIGGTPFGAPLIGWVGELFGARWTLLAGGAFTVLGALIATVYYTRRLGLSRGQQRSVALQVLSHPLSGHRVAPAPEVGHGPEDGQEPVELEPEHVIVR
jgi:MFS family permease